MDTPLVVALISALSAIVVAGLTYYLSKRREQELEWRKLKLDHYRAYLTALSGVVGSLANKDNQVVYAESVNNLQLVAPERVIIALYQFQDAIRYDNKSSSTALHDRTLSELMQAMRADIHPAMKKSRKIEFRLFDIPPEN